MMYAAVYEKDFENKHRRTYLTFLTWVSAIKSAVMRRIAYLWKKKNNDCLGHNKGSLLHFSRTTRTEVCEVQLLNSDCPEDVVLCGTRSTEVLCDGTRGIELGKYTSRRMTQLLVRFPPSNRRSVHRYRALLQNRVYNKLATAMMCGRLSLLNSIATDHYHYYFQLTHCSLQGLLCDLG
jgi:hypothetical protein